MYLKRDLKVGWSFGCSRQNPKVACTRQRNSSCTMCYGPRLAIDLKNSMASTSLLMSKKKWWFATARTANKPENMRGFPAISDSLSDGKSL